MKFSIENDYGDHSSTSIGEVDDAEVPRDLDEMWECLWTYTGDGSGGNAYYVVTILEAKNPALVGLSREWD